MVISKYYLMTGLLSLLGTSAFALQVTIKNNLPPSKVCPGGNTISIFAPNQQVIQPNHSLVVNGDFTKSPGLGIQINNWYWTSIKLPVQNPKKCLSPKDPNNQNPDNSGGQFTINVINGKCQLNKDPIPAVCGLGIQTMLIANITSSGPDKDGGCTITINPNAYTDAVTPGCCASPGFGKVCEQNSWGKTNSGQNWPPPSASKHKKIDGSS